MILTFIRNLWLLGLALQALLLVVLLGKKKWKTVPIFTAYVAFNFLECVVTYLLLHNRSAYIYVYIVGESTSVLLGLGVFYEIFKHLLQAQAALRKLANLFFGVAAALLVVLAVIVIVVRLPLEANDVVMMLTVVEEAARILELGLIVFLFVFSSIFGLHWRQQIFGIALGLGIFLVIKLADVTLLQHVKGAGGLLNSATILSFNISLLVWLGYSLAPEQSTVASELPQHTQLEKWNRAVMELIHQ